MREKMPGCAAFVDEYREVFGAGEVNQVLRLGLQADCEPILRVHFTEAGHVLGRSFEWPASKTVSVAQMVIGEQVGAPGRKRGQP